MRLDVPSRLRGVLASVLCSLTISTFGALTLSDVAQAQESITISPEHQGLISIMVGEARVLNLPARTDAYMPDFDIAELTEVGSGNRFHLVGVKPGQTYVLITYPNRSPQRVPIQVRQPIEAVQAEIDSLAPGANLQLSHAGSHLMVSGSVPDQHTADRVDAAMKTADPGSINMVSVTEPAQVELQVLFAEVRRDTSSALGLNLALAAPQLNNSQFGMIGGQATTISNSFSPILSGPVEGYSLYGIINGAVNVLAMLNVLSANGVAKIKAQPRLVSLSGQKADFHAGGETPIPVPNRDGTPSIQYKPYGVQLNVTPTVLIDGTIDLDVGIELSALDYAASVQLLGTTVPGLTSRSVHTKVQMAPGETFAVAGLIQSNSEGQESRLPGLGAIPVIGALFRQVSKSSIDTELLVYVTPRLVTPMAPGEVPVPPTDLHGPPPNEWQLFFMGTIERPQQIPSPEGDVGLER